MFILIPLALIAISAIGIAVIVYRKLPYLKKLTPESHEVGETILHDFFPELMDWFGRANFHEMKQQGLRELEKFLRKLRLAFMKVDHLSGKLITQVRHTHLSGQIEQMKAEEKEFLPGAVSEEEPAKDPAIAAKEELKDQEQKLIVEIAQNPKDPRLYEALGDLYIKLDSNQDAKDSYEAALALNPNDEAVARKYSRLLQKIQAAAQEADLAQR